MLIHLGERYEQPSWTEGTFDVSRQRISSPCPSTSAAAPVVSTRRCLWIPIRIVQKQYKKNNKKRTCCCYLHVVEVAWELGDVEGGRLMVFVVGGGCSLSIKCRPCCSVLLWTIYIVVCSLSYHLVEKNIYIKRRTHLPSTSSPVVSIRSHCPIGPSSRNTSHCTYAQAPYRYTQSRIVD